MESINELTNKVIGAALEVHSNLGPGYVESVYEEALCYELELRKIPFERQKQIALQYKSHPVGEGRMDLFIDNRLIVELKAVEVILPIHISQLVSYLKINHLEVGLLINFNVVSLSKGIRRVINKKK